MKRLFIISAAAAMVASPALAMNADDGLKIKCNGGSVSFDGNIEIKGDNGERVAIDGNRISVKDSNGEELYLNIDKLDFSGNGCKYTATVIDNDGKVVKTVTGDGTERYESETPSEKKNIVMRAHKSSLNFEEIEVSRCVRLVVEDRTDGNIIVRADEAVMPYVELSVAKGTLKARISDKFNMRRVSGGLVAVVYIPNNGRIRSIDASGASSVIVKPMLNVAGKLDIEASGASRIDVNANAGETEIECCGASRIVADIYGSGCEIDLSGASTLSLSGSVRKGEVDVSGASKFSASDMKFDSLSVDVSGASTANVSATKCIVEVSGASKADVYCDGELSAEATAASSLRYSGDCRTTHLSSSGASSIKKK